MELTAPDSFEKSRFARKVFERFADRGLHGRMSFAEDDCHFSASYAEVERYVIDRVTESVLCQID